MATIVDELVTILGVSIAADAFFKTTKFGQAINKVNTYAVAAGAAISAIEAAVVGFASKANQATLDLYQFSQVTGVGTSGLQRMEYAAVRAGGNVGDLRSMVMGLVRDMNEIDPRQYSEGLFWLVGDYRKYKDVFQLLQAMSKTLQGMNEGQALSFASHLGLSPDQLLLLRNNFQQFAKEANIIPDEAVRKTAEFTKQLNGFIYNIQTLGRTISAELTPVFKPILDGIEKWIKGNKQIISSGIETFIKGTTKAFQDFFKIIGYVIDKFKEMFPNLSEYMSKMDKVEFVSKAVLGVLLTMAGVVGVLSAKWIAIAAAIAAVATAIGSLTDGGDFMSKMLKDFETKYPHLSRYLAQMADDIKKISSAFVNEAWETIKDVWKWIANGAEWVVKALDKMLMYKELGERYKQMDELGIMLRRNPGHYGLSQRDAVYENTNNGTYNFYINTPDAAGAANAVKDVLQGKRINSGLALPAPN